MMEDNINKIVNKMKQLEKCRRQAKTDVAIGIGVCVFAICAGLTGLMGLDVKNDALNRSEQKYLDYKASVEHVEKLGEIISQIKESSIEDPELKDILVDVVQDESYTEKMYQDSLTSKDREEIAENERSAEFNDKSGKVLLASGGLFFAMGAWLAASGFKGMIKYSDENEQEMAD